MPASGGGFDQCFNTQAGVDTETMLVLGTHVSQAPNDKQQLAPALAKLMALPADLGQATDLLADTGYFRRTNVEACLQQGIEPWLALKRETHHRPMFERFAPDTPATGDPVERMNTLRIG
jgi:hypothetical protein